MNYLAFVCLFFGLAEAQERFFFNNPFFTIKKTVISTVTTSVRATCYEIVDVKSCRKKKEAVFFQPYHNDFSGAEMQFLSPGQYRSQQYVPLVPVIWDFPKQFSTPSVDSSFGESRREAGSEARSFLKYTTATEFTTVTAKMVGTQTLIVSCVAPGSTIPTPTCNIEATFPPRPASMTLDQYCAVLGEAAKMKVAECREATARKARQATGAKVIMLFTQKDGGDYPSRSKIASNIVASLVPNGSSYTLPGLPVGFKFEASAVLFASVSLFAAAGLGSNCPNGDLTCGVNGAGKCSTSGICTCNSGYTLKNNLCVVNPGLKLCPNGDQTCGVQGAGKCDPTTGICTCNNGYKLTDLKCIVNPGSKLCPNGDQTCGVEGAGKCDPTTGSCTCNAGYKLTDLKCIVNPGLKLCPNGDETCGVAGAGICSKITGLCTCNDGFTRARDKCIVSDMKIPCKEVGPATVNFDNEVCVCSAPFIKDIATGKCQVCNTKEDCNKGMAAETATECIAGECKCAGGYKNDPNSGKCIAVVGCTASGDCKETAPGTCSAAGTCECERYSPRTGKCVVCTEGFPHHCTHGFPAIGICTNGECSCTGGFKFDDTTKKCVVCQNDEDCRGNTNGKCEIPQGTCSCDIFSSISTDRTTGKCVKQTMP